MPAHRKAKEPRISLRAAGTADRVSSDLVSCIQRRHVTLPVHKITLIVLLVSACGTEPGRLGDFAGHVQVGGTLRSFAAHPPTSYDPSAPLPVLIAFHGSPGSGASLRALTGLDSIADQLGFLVAYPDANGAWNDGSPGSESAEDLDFLAGLLDTLESRISIDRRRIHLAGFSIGGLFVARAACERGHLITGITIVAATLSNVIAATCRLRVPTPVELMIGRADLAFPWDGVTGDSVEYFSVPLTMETWAGWNECAAVPALSFVRLPHSDTAIVRSAHPNCAGGGEVALYPLDNVAHAWPTGKIDAGYLAGMATIRQRR